MTPGGLFALGQARLETPQTGALSALDILGRELLAMLLSGEIEAAEALELHAKIGEARERIQAADDEKCLAYLMNRSIANYMIWPSEARH
jgi:hypothetical protein